jgi:hypothetical protein
VLLAFRVSLWKDAVFWDVTQCKPCKNRRQGENNRSVLRLLVTAYVAPSFPILVALMMEAKRCSEMPVLQESHGVTSQKTAFFIVTAAET